MVDKSQSDRDYSGSQPTWVSLLKPWFFFYSSLVIVIHIVMNTVYKVTQREACVDLLVRSLETERIYSFFNSVGSFEFGEDIT